MAAEDPLKPRGHVRRLAMMAFWGSAAAILYLSLTPADSVPLTRWDKANHVLAFAVLSVLGLVAWPGLPTRVLGLVLAYGGVIEVLQALAPTRRSDWRDLVADALGVAIGYVLVLLAARVARRRERARVVPPRDR